MFFYEYWWLVIPGLILGIWAQVKLMGAYGKYITVGTASGVSGAEAAREILDRAGLHDVPVEEIPGQLTDHYDPLKRALFLSSENYHGRSIAAVGVSAHEAGHALQHQAAYFPLKFRMMMVPATQFASAAYGPILILGILLGTAVFYKLLNVVIGIFAVIALFQIVTLPVEYDASRRAKARLVELGLVQPIERAGVNKVLDAAALTYVAAMITAVFQLLRFIMIARDRD